MSWIHFRDLKCFLCGETIFAGVSYAARLGIIDGEVRTLCMHNDCEKATQSWGAGEWKTFKEGSLIRGKEAET